MRLLVGRSSVQSGIPSLVWFLVPVSVPLFKSISMLPFPVVLFNPFLFCLRQRRIPYTVYGRAGLAGISSISAYCLFGVVHISVNVNQVIEFIPTL